MEPTRGGPRPTLPRLRLQVKDIQLLPPRPRPFLGRIITIYKNSPKIIHFFQTDNIFKYCPGISLTPYSF